MNVLGAIQELAKSLHTLEKRLERLDTNEASGGGGGGGESYLTVAAEAGLANSRQIQAGTGLQATDDGAGGHYHLSTKAADLLDDLTGTAETVGGAHSDGAATKGARSDHKHEITNPKIDDLAAGDDTTDLNSTVAKHGLMPKFETFETLLSKPDGLLINGKISVSVASNNITVAIQTLAGANPSATDVVYIRLGGVIRSISSALSVTKNAGTNWFNSGSSELATKEIDYFVYLGYNATDGVTIGFARIPYALTYGDFSTTSTNARYCAISTIANAVSGDSYAPIGRFAATLSAGAGYTWSVPTFTSTNLVQKSILETRTLVFVPTVSAAAGSPTTVSVNCFYKIINQMLYMTLGLAITNKGTASGSVRMTCPIDPGIATVFIGMEISATGYSIASQCQDAGGYYLHYIWRYDAGNLWVNGYTLSIAGVVPLV